MHKEVVFFVVATGPGRAFFALFRLIFVPKLWMETSYDVIALSYYTRRIMVTCLAR